MIVSDNLLYYGITMEQAKRICEYYGKDINTVEGYEICDMLDQIIKDLDMTDKDMLPF